MSGDEYKLNQVVNSSLIGMIFLACHIAVIARVIHALLHMYFCSNFEVKHFIFSRPGHQFQKEENKCFLLICKTQPIPIQVLSEVEGYPDMKAKQ